ncbi:MAG: UDP-N-acetylglucosamine 1-carboxyvinyltransferase [Chlamydiales bacterium]|jgi:UDP-N-acetylglucosamine 1-carboxyvinyltransferase|nr:UDP-N-acetylglucosamine 1-carboxyvinyltransferase [Chlamydiales bacterium]
MIFSKKTSYKHIAIIYLFFFTSFIYASHIQLEEKKEDFSAYLTSDSQIKSETNPPIINISKAKNSVLPLLMASLIHKGVTNLYIGDSINLLDTKAVFDILTHLGAKIIQNNGMVSIDTTEVKPIFIDQKLSSRTRYSSLALGSLASRFGFAKVGQPGGCNFKRPIDFHIKALQELGFEIIEKENSIYIVRQKEAKNIVTLPYPSVGTTLNAIFAASSLKGNDKIIEIHNCAIEPEIDDVINFLNKIGLKIDRKGRVIKVSTLRQHMTHIISHIPINDRIEAGTYMLAAAILKKRIKIIDAPLEFMEAVLNLLKQLGCSSTINDNSIIINGNELNCNASINLSTAPYPGFPTDLQPILTVLCTTLRNPSFLKEEVIPNRTDYILELNKMGAKIDFKKGEIKIFPTPFLNTYGQLVQVSSTDLRATMAIILYAIHNNICCKIDQFNLIYRGYTDVHDKIQSIGGKLEYQSNYADSFSQIQ